ncbi:ABC transporter ATP-binding protein [Natranaeroarchaeum sulfidigenes]|uniref:ABC-type multidrug transport system, ATPase component n=1 Tax=Natranaeroarchaeum sulfidigenes TaxID=2784880 RepID=A0A897MUX2_9EURY|nr:ABC transporter ATP-binding protein [Natranaeroarchaeum sulfidigenes]QSG02749.1 ABC-type multidrug transport system, ATPase component [Natranaeroarchaeum sulfidigenes]
MSAIEMVNVGKRYGDFQALDGLSLAVERGELFGLLGPNGAGKTTAIGLLTGQLTPDEGSLSVLGTDPATEPIETRRQVGIVPEKESPPSFLTPREYFDFVGQVRGISEDRLTERVDEWADRLSFADKLDAMATDLSRGQQQKVMITQAFLHDPDAVFIDEPLANLDPIMQERVKEFFERYRSQDNALLLSTHGIEVARELCDRVGVVGDGRLVAERRPAEMNPNESLLDAFEREGPAEQPTIASR